MKDLTITIAGSTGSGKTTIALLIEKILREEGVTNINMIMVDDVPLIERNINNIKENISITIKEVQLNPELKKLN